MADAAKTQGSGTASSGSPGATTSSPSSASAPDAEKFPHDYFVQNAVIFYGLSEGEVEGALVDAPRKRLTEDEAKDLVRDYKNRPVSFAGQDEE